MQRGREGSLSARDPWSRERSSFGAFGRVLQDVLADGSPFDSVGEAPAGDAVVCVLFDAFYSIRSEQQLMERLEFDLLLAGSSASASTMRRGTISTVSKNWERLLEARSPQGC